ncbi:MULTISPECIES: CDP-diacylglycerol--glycerol-3-phosphate 3-phosphatidyltransferase [unclassified Pseudoclavibacter]|uniref:CDP-diacylglycerol--glycerol-3-phosphate 3-phosphatidyltransferase n=1 Tax=unclassified Pseudoclavibacter TaxID=2615177 RepID=UPI000CE72F36|nr:MULTISPECIES: CDP-diacylglycerol--glycerol-3-phosphate 3-phosphatidyltransferase [unclassified Pseudoclavibacter]MBS3179522.1 CDP-diacylglycerol--glycerol-3-phosphate 3-phosphatidyltransferase [Pseudoclavibacter sp. Marseille-Q4354]PPG30651.1 CDP-diacylglycerol--glycerol-3-phosphate 3-phosphatidyltransferase [Pseudoclavibacter sp. RFBB5]
MTGRILRGGDGPVSNWCVPNLITIARILLVPVFVWFLLLDGNTDGAWRWAAAVLFIVAIATDSLDGHIARSRNLITDLGKLLDPIADKALTGTALVMLSVLGELPWWVTIIILVRELGITFWRLAVAKKRVLPAGRGGKLKTLVQAFAISLALLPLWAVFGDWVHWVNIVFMSAAFILTVWSGIDYLWQAYRPQNKKTPELRADDGTQR